MISVTSGTHIWLVAYVTDMRKSFNGLGGLVKHAPDENSFSGHLFIFRARKDDIVKILWADADGLYLFTKRLEYPRHTIGVIYYTITGAYRKLQ